LPTPTCCWTCSGRSAYKAPDHRRGNDARPVSGVFRSHPYPTLLAAVGDVAHPAWRARSVGVYRLWRDGGFAVGARLAGVIADAFGILAAIWALAAITAASGLVVAVRMYETRRAYPAG
jgi:hypothetical protein